MIPHPIRLRRPWEESSGPSPGQTTYRRAFKCPTGLDPWERVFLEVDQILLAGEVFLNGQPIGALNRGQFFSADVTSLLQPNNELRVEVTAAALKDIETPDSEPPPSHSVYITDPAAPPGSPIGDVRLLIRSIPSNG